MTALLLDTHALLWSVGDEDLLSPAAHEVLSAGVAPAYVSVASIWEIAIKRASGKLTVPENLMDKIEAARFIELLITFEHATIAGALGGRGSNLHHDPFDRMLVAQAQSEGLTIVTRDARIAAYDVPVLW